MRGITVQMIALRDLEANPYRHIDQYQIVDEKIERLLASYSESGFWHGSLQARPHPKKAGKYQIAFGHHRVEAARRAKLGEIGVVVSQRDNATMIRMMATENAEEFKANPLVTQETIGAVIDAYAKGEIELEAVEGHGAGQQQHSLPGGKHYSLATVARFLGWTKPSDGQATRACRIAFDAWHAEHQIGVNVSDYIQKIKPDESGRSRQTHLAAEAILKASKAAARQTREKNLPESAVKAAAKHAAAEVVRTFNEGVESNIVENIAATIGKNSATKAKHAAGIFDDLPSLPAFVLEVRDGLRQRRQNFLADIDAKLDPVLPYRDQLPEHVTKSIVKELRESAQEIHRRLLRSADAFDARVVQNVTPHPRKRLTA